MKKIAAIKPWLQMKEVGFGTMLLVLCLVNTVLFQWPLFRLAATTRSVFDLHSVLALLTLFALQLLVSFTILGVVGIVSILLFRIVCMLLVIGNAAALYFIVQYHVIIDSTMIGNVLHTDFREAAELAHPKLFLYVLMLGVFPAVVLARMRIAAPSRLMRVLHVLIALVLGTTWLYANASSWLWIDKNAKQFGGLILPWSYTLNTVRFLNQQSAQNRPAELLPPAVNVDRRGVIVVLVIGESARAQNFSLFGYGRETNPLLKKSDVIAMPGAQACATYTTAALRCMLSHRGSQGISGNDEPLPSYVHRHGAEVIWRSNNFGEPPLHISAYANADELRKQCIGDCVRANYDEVLLQGLATQLRTAPADTKTLVILHQAGSHGPQYFKKYPPEFEKFKPVCRTVELQKCTPEELVNAYDNTIVYNDYFLHSLIGLLKSVDTRPAVMIYMSDHGESLGEHGLYLHGVPLALAPDFQTSVPLLVWTSNAFARTRGGVSVKTEEKAGLTQDLIFHSVLGALGMASPIYSANQDIFQRITGNDSGAKQENQQ